MRNILFDINFRKKVNVLLSILIAFLCFLTIFTPTCLAYDGSEFDGESFKETAWDFAYAVFGDDSALNSVEEGVTFDYGVGSSSATIDSSATSIWSSVKTLYDVLSPIGVGIILLYFLLDIIEKSTHEQMSLEHFFRSTIKLIVAIFLISEGFEILEGIIDFSNALARGINTTLGALDVDNDVGDTVLDTYYSDIDNASGLTGVFLCIGITLQLILPFVILWVCNIVIQLVIWSRLLEIGIRGSLAPIGMADLFTEGTKGAGFRYLKKFIALLLQGAVILIIMHSYRFAAGGLLSGTAQMQPIEVALSMCVLSLTTMSLLMKSQNFANDVVGV